MRPRQIDLEGDDMNALLGLILRSFAAMEGRIDPPSSAHSLSVESLRRRAREEIGYLIALEDKPIACLFCKAELDALYLGKLAVDPDFQGKGLGRLLLAAAEDLALSLGLSHLRLETRIELTENHECFRRWGFEKTAENSHPGYDRTTSIEMMKRLPQERQGSLE